eukprot:34156-Prymnesium_polylepis.1
MDTGYARRVNRPRVLHLGNVCTKSSTGCELRGAPSAPRIVPPRIRAGVCAMSAAMQHRGRLCASGLRSGVLPLLGTHPCSKE